MAKKEEDYQVYFKPVRIGEVEYPLLRSRERKAPFMVKLDGAFTAQELMDIAEEMGNIERIHRSMSKRYAWMQITMKAFEDDE